MVVIFTILTIVISSIRTTVFINRAEGLNTWTAGDMTVGTIMDILILGASSWYFGIIRAVIITALSYFSVPNMCFGWLIGITFPCVPDMDYGLSSAARRYEIALSTSIFIYLAFLILSFFLTDYHCGIAYYTTRRTLILAAFALGGFLLRAIIGAAFNKANGL